MNTDSAILLMLAEQRQHIAALAAENADLRAALARAQKPVDPPDMAVPATVRT